MGRSIKNIKNQNSMQRIINNSGHTKVSLACGRSRNAVKKWITAGIMPRTEYLPSDHPDRTNYTKAICKLAKCKRSDILDV